MENKGRFLSSDKIPVYCIALIAAILNHFQVFYYMNRITPQTIMLGITHWYEDYFFYLSQLTQGAQGAWLVSNKFTTEPIPPNMNWLFHLLLGKIGPLFGAEPWVTYSVSVFVLTFAYVLIIYYCLTCIFSKDRLLRWSAFVLALVANPFFTVSLQGSTFNVYPYTYFANYTGAFNRLGGVATHLAGNILSLLLILTFANILSTLHEPRITRKFFGISLTGCVLAIGLFNVNPVFLLVDGTVIVLTSFMWLFTGVLRRNFMRLSLSLSIVFLPVIPFLLIQLSTFSQAFYQYFLTWETNMAPTTLPNFLMSTGILTILVPIGLLPFLKVRTPIRILGTVYAILPIFLYFSPIPQLLRIPYHRILQPPAYIFLASYGIYSIYTIAQGLNSIIKLKITKSIFIVLFIVVFILQLPVLWQDLRNKANDYLLVAEPNFIEKYVYQGLLYLKSQPKDKAVLARNFLELFVPVVSGHSVYYGHRSLTFNYQSKHDLADQFYTMNMNQDQASRFLKDNGIGFVVWQISDGDYHEFLKDYPLLKVIFENPKIVLFKVMI